MGELTDIPTLWMMSGCDEYVPPSVDKEAARRKYEGVLRNPRSRCVIVDGAVHDLAGHEEAGVDILADFVKSLS